MATGVGNHFKTQLSSGGISLATSTFIVCLYTTSWIDEGTAREDQDYLLNGADSSASLANFELSTVGGAYARGTLAARTFAEVDARDATEIDAADQTFSSVSSSAGVAGGVAIFCELAATDSSGRILATYHDFATPVTPNGGDITVQWSTGGFLEFLASTSDAS
jgi:hypothetical protein